MSPFGPNFRRKIIRARRTTSLPSVLSASNIAAAQNRHTIMSTSLENSLEEERYYTVDNFGKDALSPGKGTNIDEQKESTETKTNEKEEMQEDEKENLQCNPMKEMYPLGLRNWPIFNLLKLEFISQIRTVMVYGDCGNRAIIVTKDKNVYSLGYNRDDHLKTDHLKSDHSNSDTHIGIYPKKIEGLCGKNIKTFARSSYLVLALTEEGEVYSWSFNDKCKSFGVTPNVGATPTPTRMAGLSEKRIVDIACGSHHCLALTSDGQVYAWGENNFGQVGNESTAIFDGSLPRQVKHDLEGKTVVHIACGSTFNMVITDEGKLYGWGNNENNQISIDNTSTTSNNFFPAPNPSFSNPMFSNSTSSKLMFNDKTITSFGFVNVKNPNTSQYTFMNTTAAPCSTKTASNVQLLKHYVCPCQITTITDKIVNVACGDEHTLALTDKGNIYAWGKSNNGQIGVNLLKSSGPNKVNVAEMGEVSDIAAYGNLSVAVGNNKTIYVWGDCFGQDIMTPFPTKFSKIDDAFAYSKLRVMHKPLTISMYDYEYVVEGLNVLESIAAAFDDPSTTDCILQVEGQPIHVHKAILKIRCQHFKKKFQEKGTENDESTLDSSPVYTISDKFSYIVYKAFLKYLYTGKVDLPSKNALGEFESSVNSNYHELTNQKLKRHFVTELMKLADEYCETNLKGDCREIIKQEIKESNIASYYNEVMECNDKELEEYCFQFILHNLTAVILSTDFHKLNTSIKDKVMRMAAEKDLFKT